MQIENPDAKTMPCFRIRRKLGTRSSHDGEEVNCRVGRNDRQGNDRVGCEVNRKVNKKVVGSPRRSQ